MRAAAGAQQCERSVGKAAVRERQREPSRVITAEAMGESGNGSAWRQRESKHFSSKTSAHCVTQFTPQTKHNTHIHSGRHTQDDTDMHTHTVNGCERLRTHTQALSQAVTQTTSFA